MESLLFRSLSFPFGRLAAPSIVTMLLVVAGATSRAGTTLPVPEQVGREQVFVDGVADRFERVREAVATARARSGRAYRVIVVDRPGSAGDARRLLDAILDRWSSGETRESGFDPASDITILLAVNDRLLAMRAPAALEAGSGLDQATIEEELIRKVFLPRARDGLYDEGLADLVGATEAWITRVRQDEIQRIEQRRVFFHQTLPMGLATMAGVGVLGGLALQRARHARRMRVAREKLAAFKQDVVALSDLLDAQQERHRMLPHTDADFTTPMEGMTRATYDNVQGAIRRYRERWLSLMDVWEKAQERVDDEWTLGTGSADEAIRLLDSAEARPPLAEVAGECKAPLDVLEQAHEKARESSASLSAEVTACRERLEALAGRGRSAGTFQATLADVSRSGELAAAELERDPVASRGRLEQAAAALTGLGERLGAVEGADDRRRKAVEETARIETLVASRRAEGWLLAEPGANPDDRLASARSDCLLATQLLDSGETASALAHVERAEKASGEALALLESIVAARARIDELLPGCVARLEALASRRTATAREIEVLAATYAESAWSDVADNLPKADEGLARVSRLLEETRLSADPGRQHYFRAVALLEEAVRQEDWIEGCHRAVADRLAELEDLRESLPPKRDRARRRVVELADRLERQRTDRVRANERCQEAGRLLDVADAAIAVARPDVKQAARIVEAAETAAARAEDLADEDERLASQAAHDLDETDALLRRVASWYAEGVQADVRGAVATLETARSLLSRQRYEESIKSSSEASQAGRAAYAAATAEADRRRRRRQMEIQRRQMEESFSRMSRGAGPWVIQLPGGVFTGPDPWRTLQGAGGGRTSTSPTAGAGWSRDIAQVGW